MAGKKQKRTPVQVASEFKKISEVIDIKTGDKLDKIKGKVVERSNKGVRDEEFGDIDTTVEEKKETKGLGGKLEEKIAGKIAEKIEAKIEAKIDSKIDEILDKIF